MGETKYKPQSASQPDSTGKSGSAGKSGSTSKPKSTDELVQSLKDLGVPYYSIKRLDNKTALHIQTEADALCAWTRCMLDTFIREKDPTYASDAALLSPFTDAEYYELLITEFVNMICHGASDEKIPNTELLATFSTIFRYPDPQHASDGSPLRYAMKSLVTRLQVAKLIDSNAMGYKLIVSLSDVLDAMNEAKVGRISDAKLVQPLLEMLAGASESEELRISEAARYAYQALLGIPSDTSPWKKLWEHVFESVQGIAKVVGSIYSADPSKLLEGIQSLPKIVEVAKFLIETVQELSEAADSFGDAWTALKNVRRPAAWYIALRYTSMLARENAPKILDHFLKTAPWRQDKNFLCGLCAQLDRSRTATAVQTDDSARAVLEDFLLREGGQQPDLARLQTWLSLLELKPDVINRSISIKAKFKRASAKIGLAPHKYGTKAFGRIEARKPNDKLLNDAWNSDNDGLIFYADQVIRKYYTSKGDDLLKIERLNGEELHVDQFYVKLNIQQASPDEKGGGTSDKNTPKELLLEDLMATATDTSDARMRVLVHGQAGVGKTTLCKKIVYNFMYRHIWAKDIDRVIWFRLRDLGGTQTDTVKHLLEKTFFGNEPLLADSLHEAITKDKTKTLFILDGLDEVPAGENFGPGLWSELLDWPRTIVTTRTYRKNVRKIIGFGLHVESVGFDSEQVRQYVEIFSPSNSTEIQNFIQSHPVLQGFAGIPIQLDAICLSREMQSLEPSNLPESLTSLYRDVTRALWLKDVVSLGKRREGDGRAITAGDARDLQYPDIQPLVQDEINMLQALAFSGMHGDTKTFDLTYQEQLLRHRAKLLQHLPTSNHTTVLASFSKLSFLRAFNDRANRQFEFLHSTLQEYLAAQFFMEHWIVGKPLPCLQSMKGGVEQMAAEVFLAREKYTVRYELFWRFVSGLLQIEGREEDLCRFFQRLEMPPLELLGPTHQHLVMHCLREVSQNAAFRLKKEEELQSWLRFGCTSLDYPLLSDEVEFPEVAMLKVLQKATDWETRRISASLARRHAVVPPAIKDLFRTRLDGDLEPGLRRLLRDVLETPRRTLKSATINAVSKELNDKGTVETDLLQATPDGLETQGSLSDDAVMEKLRAMDSDSVKGDSYTKGVEALRGQLRWSRKIITTIIQRLEDPNREIRSSTLALLDKQLPAEVTEAVVKQLDDFPDAWDILNRQTGLTDNVLMTILQRLDNRDLRAAMELPLEGQGLAAGKFASFIQLLLENESGFTEHERNLLMKQSRVTDDNFTLLIRQLLHEDQNIRAAALHLLEQSHSFQNVALQTITDRLYRDDLRNTQRVLSLQPRLSDEILLALMQRLDNIDSLTNNQVQYMLWVHLRSSEVINSEIMRRLRSSDLNVRLNILQVQIPLNDEMAKIVLQMMDDAELLVRKAAVGALRRDDLPHECITKLVERLDDPEPEKQREAWAVLKEQESFPDAAILNLIKRLHNPDTQVDAWTVLCSQNHLPDEVLPPIIQIFNRGVDSKIRRNVVQALGAHAKVDMFADGVLVSLTQLLGTISLSSPGEPTVEAQGQRIPFNDEAMELLYELLMHRAMREKWSWSVWDGRFFVNASDVVSTSIQDPKAFMEFVSRCRPAGYPPVAGIASL